MSGFQARNVTVARERKRGVTAFFLFLRRSFLSSVSTYFSLTLSFRLLVPLVLFSSRFSLPSIRRCRETVSILPEFHCRRWSRSIPVIIVPLYAKTEILFPRTRKILLLHSNNYEANELETISLLFIVQSRCISLTHFH